MHKSISIRGQNALSKRDRSSNDSVFALTQCCRFAASRNWNMCIVSSSERVNVRAAIIHKALGTILTKMRVLRAGDYSSFLTDLFVCASSGALTPQPERIMCACVFNVHFQILSITIYLDCGWNSMRMPNISRFISRLTVVNRIENSLTWSRTTLLPLRTSRHSFRFIWKMWLSPTRTTKRQRCRPTKEIASILWAT